MYKVEMSVRHRRGAHGRAGALRAQRRTVYLENLRH